MRARRWVRVRARARVRMRVRQPAAEHRREPVSRLLPSEL